MNQGSPTICYLEDNETIRSNYSQLIETEGFNVIGCKDRKSASNVCKSQEIDLVMLDVELAGDPTGGLLLCKQLRVDNDLLPIIILSSHSHLDYRSQGLRYGADDYVTKDTELELLLVRIKTLIKRYHTLKTHISDVAKKSITGELEVDELKHQFSWKNRDLDLNLTQFWLLKALVDNYGAPVSHNALQIAANICVEPNTIAAHVMSIRQKFKSIDPQFDGIKTERGRGYRWV